MSSDTLGGWTIEPLEAICHRVSVGYVGETSSAFTSNEGVPLIRSQNVRPGRVDLAEVRCVARAFHEQNRKSQLRAGDLLIVRVGQNRGDCAVPPEGLGEVNCANIVFARPKEPYSNYLCAFFNTHHGREQLLSLSSGSAQLVLNTTAVARMTVPVPSREKAREIGTFSRHLSDRIALLRETNATLEAIAQAVFKSWFIDFDPVLAKQQGLAPAGIDEAMAALFPDVFVETKFGPVPRGWGATTLAEAFEINPRRALKKGLVAAYSDISSLGASGHCVDTPVAREVGSGAKFCNGDSLLARITPCLENGKSAYVDFLEEDEVGWGSMEFVVLRPKAPLPTYLGYLLCRHPPFREYAIHSMSGTSGRQRIQNDVLGRFPFPTPSPAVAEAFGAVCQLVQTAIAANHRQARTLAALRDTLLPRLISGQLRLPQAEALLEEATA